jgi:hypothetical protein
MTEYQIRISEIEKQLKIIKKAKKYKKKMFFQSITIDNVCNYFGFIDCLERIENMFIDRINELKNANQNL